jgi:hypothetical protein
MIPFIVSEKTSMFPAAEHVAQIAKPLVRALAVLNSAVTHDCVFPTAAGKHAPEYCKGDLRLAEETMEYLVLYRWSRRDARPLAQRPVSEAPALRAGAARRSAGSRRGLTSFSPGADAPIIGTVTHDDATTLPESNDLPDFISNSRAIHAARHDERVRHRLRVSTILPALTKRWSVCCVTSTALCAFSESGDSHSSRGMRTLISISSVS